MFSDSDEKEVASQSWVKITKALHQEGFREGVSAGRDLTFQHGFDTGYQKGFEIGFKLGMHNGLLRYLSTSSCGLDASVKQKLTNVESIEKPSRGLCAVCLEEEANAKSKDQTTEEEVITVKKVTDITAVQDRLVYDQEKLMFNENYLSVLTNTNLKELFNIT